MCILCKSRVMYQSICVFEHDHQVLYCIILHEYHMEQFFIFQQLNIMWYCVQYLYTCNVYHFDNISQYVLQLPWFILKTLLTYLNTYVCITASLHHM